ncbi:MAG: hypothetical protein GWO24_05045, partial [Akkermansiaceae bacterium]|nr:hypothetical protein [Akkermansiaceae bacterium]
EDPPTEPLPEEFTVTAVDGNTVTTDMDLAALLTPGATFVMDITSGTLTGTAQEVAEFGVPTVNDLTTPDDLSADLAVGDTFTLRDRDLVFTVAAVSGNQITTDLDLGALLSRGSSYEMTVTSGPLAGTTQGTQLITRFGVPTPMDLFTPTDISPNLAAGDTFILRGGRGSIITTDVDLDVELEQGKTYEFNVIDGELAGLTEHPVVTFGTGGGLSASELATPRLITGEVITGEVTAVDGFTVTTNRDLDSCLDDGRSYQLSFPGRGIDPQFPILEWSGTSVTTPEDISGTLSPGDAFVLIPRPQLLSGTIETVAGQFVELDLSNAALGLTRGGDFRFLVGGRTFTITNWGFPTEFFIEVDVDLTGQVSGGEVYEIEFVDRPELVLRAGDTFSISQTFEDWIQEKYDAGEVLAVDEITLSSDPDLFPGAFGIPATNELVVDQGLLGPLFAVAREDVIVFPPFPIETPD